MDTIGRKVTDVTSFNPNIIIFEEYNQKIEIWEHPRIWKLEDEDCYSDFFLQELKQIKEVLKNFVSEGYSKRYISKYEYSFLRNLAHYLSKTNNYKESFHRANGWAGKLGFEFVKAQMKIFKKKFGRIPSCEDKGKPFVTDLYKIESAIRRGYWKEFGIYKWNDLLRDVFNEVNRENKIYVGEKGLNKAKEELINFFKIHGRLPTVKDDFRNIYEACKKRYWEKWNIRTWNDLLFQIFGRINIRPGIWLGLDGLERAKKIINQFYTENKRLPKIKDKGMNGIVDACHGNWKDFGIKSWTDLIFQTFGEVNSHYGIWLGHDGLERAKKKITQFYKKNGRKPKSIDKGMIR